MSSFLRIKSITTRLNVFKSGGYHYMPEQDKKITRQVLNFMRPYFKEYFLTLVCIILGSVVSLQYPLVIKIIVDDVLVNKNTGMLLTMLIVYAGLFLLGYLFTFLTQFMNTLNTQFFAFDLKKRLFINLQNLPLSFFNSTSMGEIMSGFNSDIDTISRFLATDLLNAITNILNMIIVFIILLLLNWKLALLMLIVFPLLFIAMILTRNNFKKAFQTRRNLVTEGNELYQNVFSNMKMVKLFVAQRLFTKRFIQLQDQVINTEVRTVAKSTILSQLVNAMFLVGHLTLIWYGANLVFQDQLTIGGLMAFYTYIPSLYGPVTVLVGTSVQFRGFETSVLRISKYLDFTPEKQIKSKYRIKQGKIEIENLSFGYDEKLILKNIDLVIQPGDKVALIGKNGSGKTTLVNLLLKLYDIDHGNIYIDNADLSKYSTNYLRKNIGIVTQEINFFNLSIEDNFKIYNPRCTTKEMIRACEITGAHEFVSLLPDGYRTVIGERGYNFSGGQLQKLAISRLILKKPKIIIFDEATSALDHESTKGFFNLFHTFFKDCTTIFILHDMENVVYANQIVLFNEGMIEKIYSHQDIIDNQDLVARLVREIDWNNK
jgi:ABC-type bacteriocin/lantibiotic exporter with double-glycine peptidase domain